MKENKSIDGLTTRDAKKSRNTVPALKTANKTNAKTTVGTTVKPASKSTVKSTAAKTTKSTKATTATGAAAKTTKSTKAKTPIINDSALDINVNGAELLDEKSNKAATREKAIEDFLNPVAAYGENMKETTKDTEPKEDSKDKKKPSKKRRIITTVILVIVLGLIGLICWGVIWGNDLIAKLTGGQGSIFDALTFVDETYDPLKTDANGRTNILAFGTSGYDMSGDEGDGTHDGAQLTDSIMVISLNQETGDIAMISLPRDLKASPTCTATGKINEVYWCNGGGDQISAEDENKAAQALMDEVGDILGIDFQYYAHLNWGSLVSIVDILGGITVTLDEDIDDGWWTGAVYSANTPYTLSGEEALGLARARHGTAGGDFSRGASQQKILLGIKDKVLEKELSITDILSLVSTLGDNLRTNFTLPEMKSLAHLTFDFDFNNARQISLLDQANDIHYMTTGTLDNGISYVFPRAGVGNYSDIQEYIALQLSNDARDYEDPYILVLNASDEAGLASAEQAKLEQENYRHVAADNATEGTYETSTTLYVVNEKKSGSKKMLEDFYNTEARTDLPENITRDYDFVIILNPEKTE